MGGGPPGFPRDFTCLVVLRIPAFFLSLSSTGLLPSAVQLSSCVQLEISKIMQVLQPHTKSMVWACPVSLAATQGIEFSFFSSRYLDVSVPWVALHTL